MVFLISHFTFILRFVILFLFYHRYLDSFVQTQSVSSLLATASCNWVFIPRRVIILLVTLVNNASTLLFFCDFSDPLWTIGLGVTLSCELYSKILSLLYFLNCEFHSNSAEHFNKLFNCVRSNIFSYCLFVSFILLLLHFDSLKTFLYLIEQESLIRYFIVSNLR